MEEYFFNVLIFTAILQFSICNLHFTIPACPGYGVQMLLSKVKKTIGKYRMLAPGNIVLVAVSGGPDSVCLLSVLQALAKDLDLALHVAHLDHRFRGRDSADEAKFVAAVADKLGIPPTVEQFDVPAFCRERGLSSQAGARRVRYEFL